MVINSVVAVYSLFAWWVICFGVGLYWFGGFLEVCYGCDFCGV